LAKIKTAWFCSACGAQAGKWLGRCPSCGEWNTMEESIVTRNEPGIGGKGSLISLTARPLHTIESLTLKRISTENEELNRVLGGGLVPGSIILVGGEPGIGKSTLMLQVALQMKGTRILYVSGEESGEQIRMRADRLKTEQSDIYILTDTSTEVITEHARQLNPGLVIIDSIQTIVNPLLESTAGSIPQIRESASVLQKFAKTTSIPVILIGHITKDGTIAGPKILEHMVDTVLQFEGDQHYGYRILRAVKNRFGSASELGIFEMSGNGLREVNNPSEVLLSQREDSLSGIAVAASLEGNRPMLMELQSLVGVSPYATPQRSATGLDSRRLSMLLAVIEKKGGYRLANKDVFLNVAGGFRIDDPATDLAIVAAVLSSAEDVPIDPNVCFAAEVGLSGEIRPVFKLDQRIAEASKLGFKKMVVSKFNGKSIPGKKGALEVVQVAKLEEVFRFIFA